MYAIYKRLRKYKNARDAHNIAKRFRADQWAKILALPCQDDVDYVLKTARADYSDSHPRCAGALYRTIMYR